MEVDREVNMKAKTATQENINNILLSGILDDAPSGATHYDVFLCQFLRVNGSSLKFREGEMWKVSNHKDGVDMITNGECIDLWTKKIYV